MKKENKEYNDPITIYKFDAMEHEKLDDVKLDIAPKKKKPIEPILLALACIFKVLQYAIVPLLTGKIRIIVFLGVMFLAWLFMVICRLKKTKWDVSKLIAYLFIILLLLDLAIFFQIR